MYFELKMAVTLSILQLPFVLENQITISVYRVFHVALTDFEALFFIEETPIL